MNTQELLDVILSTVETLKTEHDKKSKAAQGRARKAASELKKLAAEYKRTSTAEGKSE